MAKSYHRVNSPADFPHEQPVGLWHEPYTGTRYDRKGGTHIPWQIDGMFTLHRNLSLVKTEITNNNGEGTTIRSYRIYELHNDEWLEIEHVPAGIFFRQEHSLWKNGAAPKGTQTVSEQAVADAIKSILGTTETEA